MPRRSSGRSAGQAPRPRPRPRPAAASCSSKTVYHHAPPPSAPAQSSSGGSFLGTMARGIAFGIGYAVAQGAVDGVMSPGTIQHETVGSTAGPNKGGSGSESESDGCSVQFKAFQDCLNSSESDISKCQLYMDMLGDCRRKSTT